MLNQHKNLSGLYKTCDLYQNQKIFNSVRLKKMKLLKGNNNLKQKEVYFVIDFLQN